MSSAPVALFALLIGAVVGYLCGRRGRSTPPSPRLAESSPPDVAVTADAAEAERRRIYRDIHDDIGSKLLTLLHTLGDSAQADQVREIMQDLRDVVSRGHTVSAACSKCWVRFAMKPSNGWISRAASCCGMSVQRCQIRR